MEKRGESFSMYNFNITVCPTVKDVCEMLSNGEYVFTVVETKSTGELVLINAYHLCPYGLEAFSFDTKSTENPKRLRRANVYYPDHIDHLDELVEKHIAKRFERFKAFCVFDDLLDLENIPQPCRFAPFPEMIA